MSSYIQRTFPRIHYETPIRFAPFADADKYQDSRIYNFSKGGLYFEPSQPISPDSDIVIVMRNYSPGTYGPEAYQSYIARIRWCREILTDQELRYGAGVQLLKRSHEILGADIEIVHQACDLCGTLLLSPEVHLTEDNICLCENCHKHLNTLPSGIIKQSINRFLMGNVI